MGTPPRRYRVNGRPLAVTLIGRHEHITTVLLQSGFAQNRDSHFPKTVFRSSVTRAAGAVLIFFSSWPIMVNKPSRAF